jgi:hypothetical protein
MQALDFRMLRRMLFGCASAAILALAAPAVAQETDADALARLEQSVLEQARRIEAQAAQLERQRAELVAQQETLRQQLAEITRLKGEAQDPASPAQPFDLAGRELSRDTAATLRAGQNAGFVPVQDAAPATPQTPPTQTPASPVGAPPPPVSVRNLPELAALPDNVGVLTPSGKLVIEPSFEYTNASSNRLVFRGVEIVTGIQIGAIEASNVDRNSLVASIAARLGLTDRLELELRVPYVYRNDEVLTLAQRDETITRSLELEGHHVGDVEVSGRYQLTSGRNGAPVWVANLRYKSTSGKGPFDVGRDEFGVASELATGSGFWGLEPGFTVLVPTDPAVIFANVGYFYHASGSVDKTINGVLVGDVDPGDSINASLGFGFAVNQRFSFSMGYRHNYIFPTETELETALQESDDLQVGSLQFGMSYRLSNHVTANATFEFGVTEDAPDARLTFRVPFGS